MSKEVMSILELNRVIAQNYYYCSYLNFEIREETSLENKTYKMEPYQKINFISQNSSEIKYSFTNKGCLSSVAFKIELIDSINDFVSSKISLKNSQFEVFTHF